MCAGRTEADSSERVPGSVGMGSQKPGPVTLPGIPADSRPPELPAASSPASAELPFTTFGLFPKVNHISHLSWDDVTRRKGGYMFLQLSGNSTFCKQLIINMHFLLLFQVRPWRPKQEHGFLQPADYQYTLYY